jgi:hypothetical protein
MRFIILAAGQSKRFLEAGYKIPKPFLTIEWRGTAKSMLGHVINSIPLGFPISVAVPAGWRVDIEDVEVIEIADTIGPAHTLRQMIRNDQDSLVVMDVDIINTTNDLMMLLSLPSSGVLVSVSLNPAYSYVTNLGSFYRIKEKQRISPYAVRGAYFICQRDIREFIDCLDRVIDARSEPFSGSEPYISHALDLLSTSKFALKTTYDPIDWGTPVDLQLSQARIIGG